MEVRKMRLAFIASELGSTPLIAAGAVAVLFLVIARTWWVAGPRVRHHHSG
jgi:hypothetical protein